MSRKLTIQRLILAFGIIFLLIGYTFLICFLDNPSYFDGIAWFFSVMVGTCLIIYREERLDKFVKLQRIKEDTD
jgi:predicted tellurium resistance membrane protein TerC